MSETFTSQHEIRFYQVSHEQFLPDEILDPIHFRWNTLLHERVYMTEIRLFYDRRSDLLEMLLYAKYEITLFDERRWMVFYRIFTSFISNYVVVCVSS